MPDQSQSDDLPQEVIVECMVIDVDEFEAAKENPAEIEFLRLARAQKFGGKIF